MSANKAIVMERLKNVMISDSNSSMETLLKVVKSDVYSLLSEYMILAPNSVSVDFEIGKDGAICLNIAATTNHIINVGFTLLD